VLHPARTPETGSDRRLPATYGELMDTVQLQVECAVALATTTRDPRAAHPQLLGYLRFLGAAGDLLVLLRELSGARPQGLGLLAARLAAVPRGDSDTGGWVQAATTLGAAHDLLGTHLGPDRKLRSPEAHEITTDTGAVLALRQLSIVLVEAAKATDLLVYRARTTQNRSPAKPIPMALFHRVCEANRSIRLHAKAALWDLDHELPAPPSSSLAHLRATSSLHVLGSSDSFPSSMAALRALRQLAFHQAHGRAPASPASVRDLARLAVAVTDPSLDWLPAPTNGLERLRRAHATDQLAPAHRAWNLACRDLPLTIQGTTKAPRAYEEAVCRLLDEATDLSPAVHLAIAAALPRLGRDAGRTIRRLHAINALVSPQRDSPDLRVQWRPITPAHAEELAERFTAAANATIPAAAGLRHLITSPALHPGTPPADLPAPAARRDLTPPRGLQR
jgi:hypothetical protein